MSKLKKFLKDTLPKEIAFILPSSIVYWAYIRFISFGTTHDEGVKYHPDEMTFSKATEIWERNNK